MRQWKKVSLAVAFAGFLASCGGGGGSDTPSAPPFKFNQLITFGDSLSDVGTYKVGAIAASGGGQFTVNSPTVKNWTELLATKYGLPAPCAAQTGFASLIPGFPGATTANNAACRNYAQGSARVTNPFGPNSKAIQDAVAAGPGGLAAAGSVAPLGLTALPVFNQIKNHLAVAPGGSFLPQDLVVILAGGNDVFLNFGGVANAGTAGAGGAAFFAGWTAAQQAAVLSGPGAASAAQAAAAEGMTKAGTELAGYVKTLIVAKGAKFVVVVNLPDVGQTPFATGFGATALLNQLATTFNAAVAAGLAGVPEVTIVDAYTQGRTQVASPAAFGLSNVTAPACKTGAFAAPGDNPLGSATGGPSITCTTTSTLVGVDTSRYQFADDVHLSPYGNQLLADFVFNRLSAAGYPN